jgi:uncharacterized membrane protein YbhN (UPF0104 family)
MRRRRRLVLRSAVAAAIIAAAYVWALPQIANYGSVGARLATVSAWWAVALAAVAILDVLSSALPWRTLLPELSWLDAIGFTQASTSLQTFVPGGAAVGVGISFGILRRLGVGAGAAGFAVALVGVWSQVTIFVYPVAGLVLVLGTGELTGAVAAAVAASGGAALLAAAVVVYALRSRAAAVRLSGRLLPVVATLARLLRREPPRWDVETLLRLRDERLSLLRRRWVALTLGTLGNQLTAYVLLDLSLRAVGVSVHELSPAETFFAWALGRLIASLPLTPGGIGLVELGLIGTLVGFGGSNAHVVAAVLLYRGLIVVPTLVAGALAFLAWRVRGVRASEAA